MEMEESSSESKLCLKPHIFMSLPCKKASHQNSIKERQIKQESSSQGSLKVNPAYCFKKGCHLDRSLPKY